MKTIISTVAIFSSLMFNMSSSYGAIDMNEKLHEVITFENGVLPMEYNSSEFVKVSFKINEEGLVEILEMNYSDEIIKTQLIEKLSELKVEENHDSNRIYNYNFTFKKI